MTIKTLSTLLVLFLGLSVSAQAQTLNVSQAVVLEGLRSQAGAGGFVAAAYAPDGSLVLLYDQHDGVRVVKADAEGATVLAQAQVGAAGDAPVAMAVDAAGNVYVAGTTTSGTLRGTGGAAFSAVADSSTNSFVAKFDAGLNLVFLTFLGAGRTAVTGVAATADAVFVTGLTYSAALPVTAAGVQQAPAAGSSGNGFVERFSADGATLVYATYLTGVNGTTTPAAIAADAADNAYVAGVTTSTGYPTLNALQARMLGTSSGFLSSLNAAGSAFGFSTFIAGGGMTGMALDASSGTLLLTGSVSLGQFPVATVAMPLTSAGYQTLLRIPVSGQSVSAGVVLAPGTQSFVSAGADGSAWVAGALGTPLFAGAVGPDYSAGDSFLVHVTAANAFDQTLRLGGAAVSAAQYASLTSTVGAPAVSAAGTTVTVPGKVTATVDASLLATERFDLPMVQAASAVLPNSMRDVVAFSCSNSSQCSGSGGLVATVSTASPAASLSVASDDLPNLTLRNMGSATATGLVLVASGYSLASDCGATLAASAQCSVALTGSGPGTPDGFGSECGFGDGGERVAGGVSADADAGERVYGGGRADVLGGEGGAVCDVLGGAFDADAERRPAEFDRDGEYDYVAAARNGGGDELPAGDVWVGTAAALTWAAAGLVRRGGWDVRGALVDRVRQYGVRQQQAGVHAGGDVSVPGDGDFDERGRGIVYGDAECGGAVGGG